MARHVLIPLFSVLLGGIPAAAESSPRPEALRGVGIDQRLDAQVPLDLTFVDEMGQPVRLSAIPRDRPLVLALVYYDCPMLCTLVLNGLVRSLRALSFDAGKEFEVVVVSFDPRETPALASAKKEAYITAYSRPGAESGWHFLTGTEDSIRRLTEAVGFHYTYDSSSGQFAHASGIMVLTPRGRLSRYLYGVEYSARDLRLALVEASANEIGGPVDQLLLFCYHYDPRTGRYGLVVMRSLRLAGIATVVALGAFVIAMIRRERRASGPRSSS